MDLIVAAVAVLAAQVVKGVTGFGSALVAVPVFAWLWGPVEAVLLMAAIDVFGGAVLLPGVRGRIDPVLLVVLWLPLTGGQVVGTALLTWLPERWVVAAMGAVVAVFAATLLWRPVRDGWGVHDTMPQPAAPALVEGALAAATGGVMTGLVGAGGPPIVVFVRRWFTDAFGRAQLIGLFWLGAITLVALLLLRGADPAPLGRIPWLLVPLLAGSLLGEWLSGRLSREVFGRAVGGILLISGLGLLLDALA